MLIFKKGLVGSDAGSFHERFTTGLLQVRSNYVVLASAASFLALDVSRSRRTILKRELVAHPKVATAPWF